MVLPPLQPTAATDEYRYAQVPEDESQRLAGSSWTTTNNATSPSAGASAHVAPEYAEVMLKVHSRRTTDLCILCTFILYWAGMCGITFSALTLGDPRRLYHSFDYGGHLCGIDPGFEDKGLLYWPRPQEPEYAVCIGQCPRSEQDTVTALDEEAAIKHGASGVETATITSKQVQIPTYPSRQIGGRFCLPLPLAEILDGGGSPPQAAAESTAPLQWPRFPATSLPASATYSTSPVPTSTLKASFSHPLHQAQPFPMDQPRPAHPARPARPHIGDFPGLLPPMEQIHWTPPPLQTPAPIVPSAPAGGAVPVSHVQTKPEKQPHQETAESPREEDEDKEDDVETVKAGHKQQPKAQTAKTGHKQQPKAETDADAQKDEPTRVGAPTHKPSERKPSGGAVEHELKSHELKSHEQKSSAQKTSAQSDTDVKKNESAALTNASSHHHEQGRRMWEEPARNSDTAELAKLLSQDHSPFAWLRKVTWDVAGAWPILVVLGVVFASLQGTGYLAFMRYCACPFTFGILFLLILASVGASVYCLAVVRTDEEVAEQLFGRYTDHPVLLNQVVGWSSAGVCALLLGISVAIFSPMRRAVGCIDGAAQAIWEEPPLFRLPTIEMIIKMLFSVSWLIFFSFVITSGQIDPPTLDVNGTPVYTRIRRFSSTPLQKFYVLVYLGGYLWTLETLSLVFHFAASFYATSWYFTPCRADGKKVGVETRLWRTGVAYALRYHLGSMAMGGLLTMLFRPIHAPMAVLAKLAKAGERHAPEGIMSNCLCCVWCFEEVVRFVNKNAIICMVLNSTNYFVSATAAVRTLAKAGHDVAFLNGFTGSLHSLGMLATACLTAYVSSFAMGGLDMFADQSSPMFVENRIAVMIAVGLLAAAVASSFMGLFDVVFDTLIFCWLADLRPTQSGVVFVPQSLLRALGEPQGRKELSETEIDEGLRGSAASPGSPSDMSSDQDARQAAKKDAARKAAAEQDALRRAAEQEALREAAEREASRRARQAREAEEAERVKWRKLQEEESARKKAQAAAQAAAAEQIELAAQRAAEEEIRQHIYGQVEEQTKGRSQDAVRPLQPPESASELADAVSAGGASSKAEATVEPVAQAPDASADALPAMEASNDAAPAAPASPDAEPGEAPPGPEDRGKAAGPASTPSAAQAGPERSQEDSLQAAEESEVFKAVGQTDPFAAPSSEVPSATNWVADFESSSPKEGPEQPRPDAEQTWPAGAAETARASSEDADGPKESGQAPLQPEQDVAAGVKTSTASVD
ncbi:SLC44A2 [Symbiodinium natans]|uniref:SLC44A2 protein n=1 Tax=Symbiodinium natans TaxID=878477 RepID=A0A812INF8_9DINO|nr:SLC44A2 [Symbiodinium natans]